MVSRRWVLRGIGGAVLGLPLLESFGPARASAAPSPHYAIFLRQGNGIVQARGGNPERYWPRVLGPLNGAWMQTIDADRATSELAAFADRLLFVKGSALPFTVDACAHAIATAQLTTAAQVSLVDDGKQTASQGESIDNFIARHHPHNGGEPLSLYTGRRDAPTQEMMSWRGPGDLRPAEDDPWTAYLRLVGGPELDVHLQDRRISVNDLVRDQMQILMSRPQLSAADRQRLELHFDSVREVELMMCRFSEAQEQDATDLLGLSTIDDNRVAVAKMHCDLIVLACACDHIRAATLQIGDGLDHTEHIVDGVRYEGYHVISHRFAGPTLEYGVPIDDAEDKHHAIDRIHLGIYRHLLEGMEAHGLLDSSVVVNCNELGDGEAHGTRDIPWVVAGRGDGTLQPGRYVDAGNVHHNRVLNTLINATGLRNPDGSMIDDFGDPALTPGLVPEML